MTTLPFEVLFGIYLGLLTGIVPALISGVLGFLFRYVTGVTLPGLGVVVLAVGIAGVNGGLLGLIDPTISQSPRLLVALMIVMMLSLYAHSQGDKLGAALPRRFSLRSLQKRALSADAITTVGGFREVTIEPAGEITDVEGYPPLPAELREKIRSGRWTFPADIPLPEIETRLGERLKSSHDLAAVSVTIDSDGTAAIGAAPPVSGLSRRIPNGQRAVSVSALVPTGIARRERVTIVTPDGERIDGTVVSARSGAESEEPTRPSDALAADGGPEGVDPPAPTAPTTMGGEGRVTVSVPQGDARTLLSTDRGRVVVQPRGIHGEFELVSLIRRAGGRFRKGSVRADGPLDGATVGETGLHDTYDVTLLAIKRRPDATAGTAPRGPRRWIRAIASAFGSTPTESFERPRWEFSISTDTRLAAGDELYVVGSRSTLAGATEVVEWQ